MRKCTRKKKQTFESSVFMSRMHLVLRINYPKSFIQHFHATLKLNGKSDVVFVTLMLFALCDRHIKTTSLFVHIARKRKKN